MNDSKRFILLQSYEADTTYDVLVFNQDVNIGEVQSNIYRWKEEYSQFDDDCYCETNYQSEYEFISEMLQETYDVEVLPWCNCDIVFM